MNLLKWLASLAEWQKPRAVRPAGMSRRGFLRALGVTAVTLTGGGLYLPRATWEDFKVEIDPAEMSQVDLFIQSTLADLGLPNFTDISAILKNHQAISELLQSETVILKTGQYIQFDVPLSNDFKPRQMLVASGGK
jgi:hypothetical protein